MRQFVWSLWNGHHLINLFDLSSGLDSRLSESVIVVFRAAMVGALKEDSIRSLLKNSGEFTRWEAARAATPEAEEVLYPPLATARICYVGWRIRQSKMTVESSRSGERKRNVRLEAKASGFEKNASRRAGSSAAFLASSGIVRPSRPPAAAAIECKRLGRATKPMFAVPNHMLEQFSTETLTLNPTANILVAGKKDFEASRRARLFSRIATGN